MTLRCTFIWIFLFASYESLPAASFIGLGFVDPTVPGSIAYAASANGSVVVGTSSNGKAFIWTPLKGMEAIPSVPNIYSPLEAWDVSHDGTTVVGKMHDVASGHDFAFRWPVGGQLENLGALPGATTSVAHGISGDGSTIVGFSYDIASSPFTWSAIAGMSALPIPAPHTRGDAVATSYDGTIAVGVVGGLETAVLWSPDGVTKLGSWEGAGFQTIPFDVSSEGTVVVGQANTAFTSFGSVPFRWTEQTGLVPLADPDSDIRSIAVGVSADGKRVVGARVSRSVSDAGFLWDEEQGLRDLQTVLRDDFHLGTELEGWSELEPEDISADSRTIVGIGRNPDGNREAFVATIPEPPSALMAALAVGCGLHLARRRLCYRSRRRVGQAQRRPTT